LPIFFQNFGEIWLKIVELWLNSSSQKIPGLMSYATQNLRSDQIYQIKSKFLAKIRIFHIVLIDGFGIGFAGFAESKGCV